MTDVTLVLKTEKEGRLLPGMYETTIYTRASVEAKDGKDDANIQGCPETMDTLQLNHHRHININLYLATNTANMVE